MFRTLIHPAKTPKHNELRTRRPIHKELRSQCLDYLTYKDTRSISRNIHKARSSQMLPLPTDIEETHEANVYWTMHHCNS